MTFVSLLPGPAS